jgi:hypothetical protein
MAWTGSGGAMSARAAELLVTEPFDEPRIQERFARETFAKAYRAAIDRS